MGLKTNPLQHNGLGFWIILIHNISIICVIVRIFFSRFRTRVIDTREHFGKLWFDAGKVKNFAFTNYQSINIIWERKGKKRFPEIIIRSEGIKVPKIGNLKTIDFCGVFFLSTTCTFRGLFSSLRLSQSLNVFFFHF